MREKLVWSACEDKQGISERYGDTLKVGTRANGRDPIERVMHAFIFCTRVKDLLLIR